MRGLVFGNSHVGAVRAAWGKTQSADLDLYAIPGGSGPNIKIVDGRIHPRREDGKVLSSIEDVETQGLDLSAYDYIAFCSLGLPAVRETFHTNILRKISLADLKLDTSKESLAVSRDFMKSAIECVLFRTPGAYAIRQIRRVFKGPILCVASPIPVVSRFEEDHSLHKMYGPSTHAFISWYSKTQLSLLRKLAASIDSGIVVLDFPDPAWADAGSTPEEFGTADPWHMNVAYGELLLDQFRAARDAFPSG